MNNSDLIILTNTSFLPYYLYPGIAVDFILHSFLCISQEMSVFKQCVCGVFNLSCRRAEDAATQLYLILTVKPPQSRRSKASWISSPVESF